MLRPKILALLSVLAVAFGIASCSSTVTPPANAPVIVVPAMIEFGTVRVGLRKDTSVTISNNGNAALKITSQSFSGSQFILADSTQSAIQIEAGAHQDVRIRFMPKDSGDIVAYDSIRSNAGMTVVKLHAGGIALTRVLQSDASVDFGDARLGLCADSTLGATFPRSFVLRNTGNDTLRITGVTAQSPDFTVFAFPSVIPSGDSGMVSLRFCPSKVGAASSTITIASNATSSNTMSIMATGRGVPYSPGVGSNYTYQAIRLDSAGKPTGAGFLRSTNVIATGLSYNGKSGVTQVNDGNDSYFKIEDDGDVSSYSKGHQTVDSVTFFGATWWKLPFSTRGQNVSLFNDSTTFTSGSGQVGLRVTASASYKGDTILKRGGRSVTVEMVDVSDIATYSATQGRLILVSYMGLFFDPSIGFIARQGVVTDSYTIVGATVKLQGGGEYRDLKSFYLK